MFPSFLPPNGEISVHVFTVKIVEEVVKLDENPQFPQPVDTLYGKPRA